MKTVTVECPKCSKSYTLPKHLAGFIIECPKCKEKFYLSADDSFTPNMSLVKSKNGNSKNNKIKKIGDKPEKTPKPEKQKSKFGISGRKQKVELSDEDKAYEKMIKHKLYKYVDLIINVSGIFSVILISISLFLPTIILSKTETLSIFSTVFNLSELGAILSIISPEKFLFYLIVLIPISSLISIIFDIKSIITKNAGQMFYRLISMLICIGYFGLVSTLILGGGIKFDASHQFIAGVRILYENNGIMGVFKNVFSFGSMILFFGFTFLIIVNFLDFMMFLKRRRIEV